jgi:hypothetical protein
MATQHKLTVSSRQAPTVEFDPAIGAVYIRFKRATVARTYDRSTPALTLTVDVDARGDVLGIEAIGCNEVVINQLLTKAKVQAPHSPLERARFRATPQHAEAVAA